MCHIKRSNQTTNDLNSAYLPHSYVNICIYIIRMKNVEGIILILSCQKHKQTRLKEFSLPENNYNGWEVIYVLGDLFLNTNYELRENMLYIKCEDSYIHLLKKLSLSIKYVNEIFTIKQGILRCGDDLIFNNTNLVNFLKAEKYDFYGQSYCKKDYFSQDINVLKNTVYDKFMYDYYKTHQEDFNNPHHNLQSMTLEKLKTYLVRPKCWGASGVLYYLSNRSCKILVEHMEAIDFNIFHFDEFTNSYPYTIEDCGVTYIMYYNRIKFTNYSHFFDSPTSIAKHTNKYR
jgi:hypothetical protein